MRAGGRRPTGSDPEHVAGYVRELSTRPSRRGADVVSIDWGSGLANATIELRLSVPVRLFYDFLIEEGLREFNPVGRGRLSTVVVTVLAVSIALVFYADAHPRGGL